MKKISLIALLAIIGLLFTINSKAQASATQSDSLKTSRANRPITIKGLENLSKHMAQTIRYPRWEREKGQAGFAVVGFEVDTTGHLQNIALSLTMEKTEFGPECLRTAKGFKGTVNVPAGKYTLLVLFRLDGVEYPDDKKIDYSSFSSVIICKAMGVVRSTGF